MLKNGIRINKKSGLHYIVQDDGRLIKFRPWLGDAFLFMYDVIMKSSVFPKKFGAGKERHSAVVLALVSKASILKMEPCSTSGRS